MSFETLLEVIFRIGLEPTKKNISMFNLIGIEEYLCLDQKRKTAFVACIDVLILKKNN